MKNDEVLVNAAFAEHRKQYIEIEDVGKAFEVFCSDMALRRHRLSLDEIFGGQVAGGKDGGIDSIYLFVNGRLITDIEALPDHKSDVVIEVCFLQAKHSGDIEQIVVQKLTSSIPDFLSLEPDEEDFDELYNDEFQYQAELFREIVKKYQLYKYQLNIEIGYLCRATNLPTRQFEKIVEKLIAACKSQFRRAEVEFKLWGADELYQASIAPLHLKKTLDLPAGSHIGDKGSYLALVRLDDFISFVSNENGEIDETMFEFNVRDFEGDTKPVNRAIAETIKNPHSESDFWWHNNGVTLIASDIDPGQKNLVISDPMIVNGLQTTNVLFNNKSSIIDKANDDRRVLVKIISVEDQLLRSEVIKATNSQTKISSLALKATEDQQRRIEEYLRSENYFYERRRNYYKNRKMPSLRIVDMQRLGQGAIVKSGVSVKIMRRPDLGWLS